MLKLSRSYKHEESVKRLALKAFKIVSDLKQKLYIRNHKILKLLATKNSDCSPFR